MMSRKPHTLSEASASAPDQQTAPPQPSPNVVLLVLKTTYNNWIAAGGTPPIYGNVAPPAFISPPQ